jgi:hypothetical protein
MEIKMTPIQKEWFTPTVHASLQREGLETLEQIAAYGHRALARCPYIADKNVARMNRILIDHGLCFFDDYNPQKRGSGGGSYWTPERLKKAASMLDAGMSEMDVARCFGKDYSLSMRLALDRYGYSLPRSATLVARLRAKLASISHEAADRIEELEAKVAKLAGRETNG